MCVRASCVGVLLLGAVTASAGVLEIHHIDVGQGDATLIIGPDGTTVLVDAGDAGYFGAPNGGAIVFDYLQALGVTHLDVTVATHRDADHVGGLAFGAYASYPASVLLGDRISDGSLASYAGTAGVDDDGDGSPDFEGDDGCGANAVERPDPEELGSGGTDAYLPRLAALDNGEESTTAYCSLSKTYRRYVQTVEAAGLRVPIGEYAALSARFWSPIDLGDGATATLVCGSGWVADDPVRVLGSDSTSDPNPRSLGLYVQYGGFDYLVAGDLTGASGAPVEQAVARLLGSIADSPPGDPLDVLRLNHHGSASSTAEDFLADVWPEVAVLSCGDGNSYGHPAQETVDRLATSRSLRCVYATEEGMPRDWSASCHQVIGGAVVLRTDGVVYTITNSSGGEDVFAVDTPLFVDGLESGTTSAWTHVVP